MKSAVRQQRIVEFDFPNHVLDFLVTSFAVSESLSLLVASPSCLVVARFDDLVVGHADGFVSRFSLLAGRPSSFPVSRLVALSVIPRRSRHIDNDCALRAVYMPLCLCDAWGDGFVQSGGVPPS
eukprot:1294030-Amphidinium_carterae.1